MAFGVSETGVRYEVKRTAVKPKPIPGVFQPLFERDFLTLYRNGAELQSGFPANGTGVRAAHRAAEADAGETTRDPYGLRYDLRHESGEVRRNLSRNEAADLLGGQPIHLPSTPARRMMRVLETLYLKKTVTANGWTARETR